MGVRIGLGVVGDQIANGNSTNARIHDGLITNVISWLNTKVLLKEVGVGVNVNASAQHFKGMAVLFEHVDIILSDIEKPAMEGILFHLDLRSPLNTQYYFICCIVVCF